MTERSNVVTFKGNPLTLTGEEVREGDQAKPFRLTANDLSDLCSDAYEGKVVVLSVVPSLDTPVCATQTRVFNLKASGLSEDVAIITVSLDLPFAQSRFCGAEGIDRVVTASDYKYRSFGESYGVFIKELGLLARAVFVLDRAGRIAHVQYVPEISTEPDYESALEAVRKAI